MGRDSFFVGCLLRNVVRHTLINEIISIPPLPLPLCLALLPLVVGMRSKATAAAPAGPAYTITYYGY